MTARRWLTFALTTGLLGGRLAQRAWASPAAVLAPLRAAAPASGRVTARCLLPRGAGRGLALREVFAPVDVSGFLASVPADGPSDDDLAAGAGEDPPAVAVPLSGAATPVDPSAEGSRHDSLSDVVSLFAVPLSGAATPVDPSAEGSRHDSLSGVVAPVAAPLSAATSEAGLLADGSAADLGSDLAPGASGSEDWWRFWHGAASHDLDVDDDDAGRVDGDPPGSGDLDEASERGWEVRQLDAIRALETVYDDAVAAELAWAPWQCAWVAREALEAMAPPEPPPGMVWINGPPQQVSSSSSSSSSSGSVAGHVARLESAHHPARRGT